MKAMDTVQISHGWQMLNQLTTEIAVQVGRTIGKE